MNMTFKVFLFNFFIALQCVSLYAGDWLAPSSSIEGERDKPIPIRWNGFRKLPFVPRWRTFVFNISGKKITRDGWDNLSHEENDLIQSTPPKFIKRTTSQTFLNPIHKTVEFTIDPLGPNSSLLNAESKWKTVEDNYKPRIESFVNEINNVMPKINNKLVSVLVAGSLAGGYFTYGSDIDIVLVLEHGLIGNEQKFRLIDLLFILWVKTFRGDEIPGDPKIDFALYSREEIRNLTEEFNILEPRIALESRIADELRLRLGNLELARHYSLLRGAVTIWGEDVFLTNEPSLAETIATDSAI